MDTQIISKELLNTTQKQLGCFNGLIKLSEEQESILIEGRHGELADNLSGFDPLLLEFQQLAKRDEALRRRLKSAASDSAASTDYYEQPYKQFSSALAEKASRLQVLTETNRELLGNAMELIGFSMAVIGKVASEEQFKTNPQASSAIVFDLKV